MKKLHISIIALIILSTSYSVAQSDALDLTQLLGRWKLDMSPQDSSDDNFALMEITGIDDNTLVGTFYREGVKIQEGAINTQSGRIYAALISGDNSGQYHTSFYYEDGLIYGSTHAIDRGFLSVWIASRDNEEDESK